MHAVCMDRVVSNLDAITASSCAPPYNECMPTKTRPYLRSGFYSKQTTALAPAPDSPVGKILRERREDLIADLGGQGSCSTAQLALVDLIVAAWAQLDSVTGYLLTLPSLVDKRHRRVWQVVRDRAALATQLQSLLRDIGLERQVKKVESLGDYIKRKDAERTEADTVES